MSADGPLHFETLAAQAGLRMRVGDTISTSPAIDASSTFTYESIDEVHEALGPESRGFAYARNANPTVVALEEAVAPLEGTEDIVAFGSGMGAISACFTALQLWPGDVVLAGRDLYGVTRSFFSQLSNFEIDTQYIDVHDLSAVERFCSTRKPRVLFFETITNPLLRVPDAAALVEIAHRHNATVVVDNTFATPYLFRPVEVGVDVVVESATKYIAGHGDVIAGLVACDRSMGRRVRDARTVAGSVLSPFEAWLALRGLRTLPLRMERQCSNALCLAHWLSDQPWVQRVYYPGLPGHPQHEVATRQFGGRHGGMVAFEVGTDREATLRFMDALRLITPGTSLGDVESLALYPPLSSHRTLSDEQLTELGIGPGLVRLSVGIEHLADLENDLARAAGEAGIRQ